MLAKVLQSALSQGKTTKKKLEKHEVAQKPSKYLGDRPSLSPYSVMGETESACCNDNGEEVSSKPGEGGVVCFPSLL